MSARTDIRGMECAEVTFEMRDEHYGERWYEGTSAGDLLWNPKGGDGHVLVEQIRCGEPIGRGKWPEVPANCGCGGYFNPCPSLAWICECGEDDSCRDHHYELLARASAN